MSSTVSIVKAGDSVVEAVRQAMELAGWQRFITPGADVSIKVNLGWNMRLPGAITSPWVAEGVIRAIREHVGKIYLVESDQVLVRAADALRAAFMDRVCRRYDVPFVNMSEGRYERVDLPDGLAFKSILAPEILRRTEMITVPVMKTHDKSLITGPIKNQWGCLDKHRHNHHLVLTEALVDINRVFQPRFAVLDATVGMDGDAPKSGRPRIVGLVLASGDIVALEAIQAEIMGFDSRTIPHLRLCEEHGLGTAAIDGIEVVGEDFRPFNFHFVAAHHNIVSVVELALRNSFLRPLVFHTPLFSVCCLLARLFYWFWFFVGRGHRLRDSIIADPRFGRQWTEAAWQDPPAGNIEESRDGREGVARPVETIGNK